MRCLVSVCMKVFNIVMQPIAIATATLTLSHSLVYAELSTEAHNALFDLPAYAKEVQEAAEGGLNARGFFMKSENCLKLVAKGKELGVADTEVIGGNGSPEIRFGEASKVCEEHRRWQVTLEAARELHNFGLSAPNPDTTKPGELGAKYAEVWSAKGKECVDATKKFIAQGAYADKKISQLNFKDHTIGQALARCEIMVGWGKKYAVDTEVAKKAKADTIRAKYANAGFKGKKLEYFMHYDGVQWKVAGCRNEDDLKKLNKATKLFQWLEHNDGTYGIRTVILKGNTVASVTDTKYLTAERAKANCK